MNILRLFSRLIYGGDPCLNPAEMSLVKIVASQLPEAEGGLIQDQVSCISTVQRPHPGREIVCFYPKRKKFSCFDDTSYERCLASIRVKNSEGRRKQVKLLIHRGCFQSIEGHIPENPITEANCEVELWPNTASTLPQAIDRLEHGESNNAEQTDEGVPDK